jgi:hybrid cluster-associated redox disulfide protein
VADIGCRRPSVYFSQRIGLSRRGTSVAFTEDMLIRDVLVSHPDAANVFERHGLACASCLAAGMESVAAVASMHEVSVEGLLAELNDLPAGLSEEE